MSDKHRKLLDLLRPLLPITEEMEHQIIHLGNRMVVDTTICVKVILERRSKEVWTNDANPSGILVTIIYSGRPAHDPILLTFAVEDLSHAIQATSIMEDAKITYLTENLAIDEDGNIVEDAPPARNVLARLMKSKSRPE